MVYRVLRDDVVIADNLTDPTYTDSATAGGTVHTYRVEKWDGTVGTAVETDVDVPYSPLLHVFVSSKTLGWSDLPTKTADNGTLKLINTEMRDDVPVLLDTRNGEEVTAFDVGGGDDVSFPDWLQVTYETRAAYTYEADFDWDNSGFPLRMLGWLVDVVEFKKYRLATGNHAFYFCQADSLAGLADLRTDNLTDMAGMFYWSHMDQPLNHFDTSNVLDMSSIFRECFFTQPLDQWDVSNVTNLDYAFIMHATFNQPLPWDVSNVTSAEMCLDRAVQFDQDLSGWCVEKIPSAPNRFLYGTPIQDQPAKHPKWGQPC